MSIIIINLQEVPKWHGLAQLPRETICLFATTGDTPLLKHEYVALHQSDIISDIHFKIAGSYLGP